jgi:hypothetical protein
MAQQAKVGRPHKVSANRNPAGREGAPVSLYPLSFEDAVAGLAQVKLPDSERKRPKAKAKKGE